MEKKSYILKRPWQSKSGFQEMLYLGYNDNNKIDYVPKKEQALKNMGLCLCVK